MEESTKQQLMKMLRIDEGVKSHCYLDTMGLETIAVGRNISKTGPGLRDCEIDFMLSNDIEELYNAWVKTYPWFKTLSEPRKAALIDFSFMGMGKVAQFKSMLKNLSLGNYNQAAACLMDSLYATQVGDRAKRLAKILVNDAF